MTSPITTPNIQRKIHNLKLKSTVTFSIQEAKKSIDDHENNNPPVKSPYYEEYNFYSCVDKMGFSVETAVTSLAKRMNNWHYLWVSNFEQYQEYSPQQYIKKLKKYIDAYKNYPEIDYSVSIAKTRNNLVYYLNMHSDPDNPVTLSEETIEDIETTLDASVAKIEQQGTKRGQFPTDDSTESPLNKKIRSNTPVPSPQEKSSSDKTVSSHPSGSSFTSENSGAEVSDTARYPTSSPA